MWSGSQYRRMVTGRPLRRSSALWSCTPNHAKYSPMTTRIGPRGQVREHGPQACLVVRQRLAEQSGAGAVQPGDHGSVRRGSGHRRRDPALDLTALPEHRPAAGARHHAAAYEEQVTGSPAGTEYALLKADGNGDVRFDGWDPDAGENGRVIEAKGPGYNWMVGADGEFNPKFGPAKSIPDQLERQSEAARAAGQKSNGESPSRGWPKRSRT